LYVRIKIAGLGGQGVKLAGVILGHVVIEAGFDAIVTTQYTPATRGGPISSSLILSDDRKIVNPFFEKPDILCVLAVKAWKQQKNSLKQTTYIIYDSDIISKEMINHPVDLSSGFALSSTASKHGVAINMLLVGTLAYKLNIGIDEFTTILGKISYDNMKKYSRQVLRIDPVTFEKAISKHSPVKFRENNLKAMKLGYSIAEKYPRLRL